MTLSFWQRLKRQFLQAPFFIRLTRWEFWPFGLVYFPIAFYYPVLALRARSLFFFSAVNPSIESGGVLGESKADIFKLIPKEYIPDTQRFEPGVSKEEIVKWMELCDLSFPILFKPDIGERGWMVKKIESEQQIEAYLLTIKVKFLAQAYVSYPLELGLFYYRYPGAAQGTVSSITRKGLMTVTGNGRSTVRELLNNDPRARLYVAEYEKKYPEKMDAVAPAGEALEVEPIGNHCRGTTFYDDTGMITDKLRIAFNKIAGEIPGFYFGRFDLRCSSYKELENGTAFKILELNGAGAEPGHIYHPGRPMWKGYLDILHHLNVLCNIAILNHRLGVPYMSAMEGLRFIRKIRQYNRTKDM